MSRPYKQVASFIRRSRESFLLATSNLEQHRRNSRSEGWEIPRRRRTVGLAALLCMAAVCASAAAQANNVFSGTTAVGQSSSPLSVVVTMTAGGVAGTPVALTQGVANSDFALASGGTCAAGTSYSAGQQCTAMVVFQPKYPGPRSGAVVIKTSGGSYMGSALLAGVAVGSLPVIAPGTINTVAGDADWTYQSATDGGPEIGRAHV